MANERESWIAGQGKRNIEDARRKAAANTPQVMMSQTPEWYQDRGNLSRAKDVLQHVPAVTTDPNESRNMYQMLMNQMKGGDKGARLIDTKGLPAGAIRTGRTLFTDPAKSQGFLKDLRSMVGDIVPGISRRPNPAAVRAPEYNPFPKAGFGEKYYKKEFPWASAFSNLMGLAEKSPTLSTISNLFPKKERIPLERDLRFTPVPGSADWESSIFDPIEDEPITFLPQDAYEGSGMETDPFYNPNLRSSGSPFDTMDITNDIVGDGPDIAEAYELEKEKLSKEEPSKYPLGNIGSIFEGEDYSPDFDNFINKIQDPVSREAAKNAALAFQMYYKESQDKFDPKFEELYQVYVDAIIQGRLVDGGISEPQ